MRAAVTVACALTLNGCFLVTSSESSVTSTAAPSAKSVIIEPSAAPASALAPSARASPSAAPALDEKAERLDVASYKKDRLDECLHVEARATSAADSYDRQEVFNRMHTLRSGFDDSIKKDPKSATILPTSCADAFKDRSVLATCTELNASPKFSISVVEQHYLFETVFADDAVMRRCLAEGGKWEAVAHDSDEFKTAERESRLRTLEELSKQH